MTRERPNHFDLCYCPKGTFAYNLRVATGSRLHVCVNWPLGGKPGSSGPRLCHSLQATFALMRASWAQTVEEGRTEFTVPNIKGWERIPVGTPLLGWARREGELIYALPPHPLRDVDPWQGIPLGSFPEFTVYLSNVIIDARNHLT